METDCSGSSLASPRTTQRAHYERNVVDRVFLRELGGNMISRLVTKGGKAIRERLIGKMAKGTTGPRKYCNVPWLR